MTPRKAIELAAWRRIAMLFRELSDVCERLVDDGVNGIEPNKPRRQRITRPRLPHRHVPDVEPSELDVARAKAILRKLGRL